MFIGKGYGRISMQKVLPKNVECAVWMHTIEKSFPQNIILLTGWVREKNVYLCFDFFLSFYHKKTKYFFYYQSALFFEKFLGENSNSKKLNFF